MKTNNDRRCSHSKVHIMYNLSIRWCIPTEWTQSIPTNSFFFLLTIMHFLYFSSIYKNLWNKTISFDWFDEFLMNTKPTHLSTLDCGKSKFNLCFSPFFVADNISYEFGKFAIIMIFECSKKYVIWYVGRLRWIHA